MINFVAALTLLPYAFAFSSQYGSTFKSSFHVPGRDWQDPPMMGNGTFQQLIDHKNPGLGTFSQFYYWSDEFWAGPGSPMVLNTPGEINVTGYQSYLSTNRTTGVIAQAIGAGVIVLEHRYWGMSSPFAQLTTANMKYLTLENSIADLNYFASNVHLPFDRFGTSAPSKAPWVFAGGSYSGALAAWTEATAPGTFWAYLASSAPVEAISDYWAYFAPVQQGMPANCSKDVSLVIDYMDNLLTTGSAADKLALKTRFGLQGVVHNDDFMSTLENGPWLWQGNQFYRTTGFYDWCDAIEGVNASSAASSIPGAAGVGLEKALAGYAQWVNSTLLPGYCGSATNEYDISCIDTYNASSTIYTDVSLSNQVDRQWMWMLCNEPFGYWQDGAPAGRPSIVSRLVTAQYWQRQCALYFPTGPNGETFASALGKTEADLNAYTKGWNTRQSTRLIYANGQLDPWREAGVSSDFRPGGPLQSTPQVPVNVVPGGFHTSDLVTRNGAVNAGAKQVIDAEVAQIKAWVAQYPKRGPSWGWPSWGRM